MWVEILCGLVAYKIIRRVFFSDDDLDQLADLDSSHSHLCLAVASRLEKLYAGRCFVGLRIPDPDAGARQHVDVVLVTKREVMVVAIKNCSGFVEVDKDGNWSCPSDKKHKQEVFPNPVLEVNRLAANLQSYLEQRGATLPDGRITGRVVLPNPNCRLVLCVELCFVCFAALGCSLNFVIILVNSSHLFCSLNYLTCASSGLHTPLLFNQRLSRTINGKILRQTQRVDFQHGLKVHFMEAKVTCKIRYSKIYVLFSARRQCGTGWNSKGTKMFSVNSLNSKEDMMTFNS